MPFPKDPLRKGNLVIKFVVEMPPQEFFLDPKNLLILSKILPQKQGQGESITILQNLLNIKCLYNIQCFFSIARGWLRRKSFSRF